MTIAAFAAGCGGGPTSAAGNETEQAVSSTSIKAKVGTIARTLSGEKGPFADKAYWLIGTQPDGTACEVTVSRDDEAFIEATIYTVGSHPPVDMGFDLFVPTSAANTPDVIVTRTAALLQVAVNEKNVNGGLFSNNLEAHFTGPGGYAGLERVRIFTDDEVSGSGGQTTHVESSCLGLKPLLELDRVAEGAGLAKQAQAFYEGHHTDKLATPIVMMGCGFGDATDRLVCTFDCGEGDPEHDVPPDQLEVTFRVGGQKIGGVVKASLDGR